jgi:CelD/BcsL family acetyltransferase involved in cellulose biosynthesis
MSDLVRERAAQYEIVSDEHAFRALEQEWNALWRRAQGRYYQAFNVCLLAWQYVAKPVGRDLRCIVARLDGRVVMIWPLVTYRKWLWRYALPLSPDAGDYTSVLVEDGHSAAALVAGAWDTARRRCHADFMLLPYLREGQELYRVASRERHTLLASRHDAWVAELSHESQWDTYCQSLGTLFRKKPGSFARRLAKEGNVTVSMTDPADIETHRRLVDWMLSQKQSWGQRVDKSESWISSPRYRDFLVHLLSPESSERHSESNEHSNTASTVESAVESTVASTVASTVKSPFASTLASNEERFRESTSESAQAPIARMIVVTLDGAPVAALITSIGNPCANAIISGFDANHGKASPGTIAVEHAVRWAFDHGWDLDFGVGTEQFKSYWSRGNATSAWTLHVITSRWGRTAVALKHAFKHALHRIVQAPETHAIATGNASASPLTPSHVGDPAHDHEDDHDQQVAHPRHVTRDASEFASHIDHTRHDSSRFRMKAD